MSDYLAPLSSSSSPQPRPDALLSHIAIGKPNASIPLYTGRVEFSQSGSTSVADAEISLRWLPVPTIHFEATDVPSNAQLDLGESSLRLEDHLLISRATVTRIRKRLRPNSHKLSISGLIGERVVRVLEDAANYVMFLLPNFDPPSGRGAHYPDGSERAARLILSGSGWVITLDDMGDRDEVIKYLKANSGFGLTQVGRLEKEDKSSFSEESARTILYALGWYVSFASGQWIFPCLPAGFNVDGKQVWKVWDNDRTTPFRPRSSWLDRSCHDQLEAPFLGFMKLWLDDTWQEVIRIAIHWYIEANAQAGSTEGSIVLTQMAFELLASTVLADHDGSLSQAGFDKLAAADRIRLLFRWAGISTDIPRELSDLIKLANAHPNERFRPNKNPDSANSMSIIRNTITHPTRKNREQSATHPAGARVDAWRLGLRNLELCLLKLFGHQGTYSDRIKVRRQGEVERVPWSK